MRTYSAFLVFFLSVFTAQAQFSNGQAARAVLGQTNFTAGNPSPSQQILGAVGGLAYSNGYLYVADSNRTAATPNDSRIMAFPTAQIPGLRDNLSLDNLTNSDCYLCGFPASFSLGQSSFTPPSGGFVASRTQSGMENAAGVATDGHYFAVADTDNNRVLLWNEVPTVMNQPADIVLGQTNFTSFFQPQAVNASALRGPQGLWIQNNKLYVADTLNNRVLIWNSIPTQNNQPADIVLGQVDFVHNTQPGSGSTGPAAANQLLNPTSVTSDGVRLFVADLGFNRVLIWNSIPTSIDQNADVAVGQPDLVQTVANNPAVCSGYAVNSDAGQCQTSLNFPRFALSTGTRLYIADSGNDRVVALNVPTASGAAFDEVIGQPDFIQDVVSSASISIASTAIDNTGGVDLVPAPQGLAYDGTNLYVSDPYNRRVLIFTPGDNTLAPNSIVNWASEIVRQEGIVSFTLASGGSITAGDTVTVTIAGTAYTYPVVKGDTLGTIAQGVVSKINASDPNVTAIFAGFDTTDNISAIYLSSKNTDLGYDTISLAASESNSANEVATASDTYLTAGTAATGSIGMLVEIDGTNLSDQTTSAVLDGVHPLPTNLGGVNVYMDGWGSPLLKVSPTQIVTQIPYQYLDRNSTSVYVRTVHNDGTVTVTTAAPVYIAPANPGIFNAPATAGQARPWPVQMAYHQPGNATSVVSIDGSVTAGNTATITIQGTAYTYPVVAADTLATITQNLINLINASDPNVTASAGGAFTRVVLTAKQAEPNGNGITVSGTTSTGATVTVTAYSSATCCYVTPGSLITTSNPAGPNELITITTVGLGAVIDTSGNILNGGGTGFPYAETVPNNAYSSVSATVGTTTAQVIFAEEPTGSYGTYNIQLIIPSTATTNANTPLYVAQNAFISNTVTIPIGPTSLYVAPTTPTPTAPASNIHETIDSPAANATVSGTFIAFGWALNSKYSLSEVTVSVDGRVLGEASRFSRPDVCAIHTSPDCPETGWSLNVDSTQFADGTHSLSITSQGTDGSSFTIARSITISNNSTAESNSFHVFIDSPANNVSYRGTTTFSGWALNDSNPITSVDIYIDGALKGSAAYGESRPDVCLVYPGRPGCPSVGWYFTFDTTTIADGSHLLVATVTSASGQNRSIAQNFQVQNFSTFSATHVSIDSPSAQAGTFSGALVVGGWAVNDNSAVASVLISVDGVSYGAASYGFARPDVCAAYPGRAGCPDVGFNALLDTTLLTDGTHTLTVTVNPVSGQGSTYTRTFSVANSSASPIRAFIDVPSNGSSVTGQFGVAGWALNATANDTVNTVTLLIDGLSFGNATYGTSRADVCAIYPASADCPGVGWSAALQSTRLTNGSHVLEVTVTTVGGHHASYNRTFSVSNPNSGSAQIFFDSPGAGSNPFLGIATFAGWAINSDTTSVSSLSVTIDGVPYGSATYGLARPDVCLAYPGRAGCPNVGWSFGIDTTQLTDGTHTLGLTENNADGTFYSSSTQFTVANYTAANTINISLSSPAAGASVFGSINIAGWAVNPSSKIGAIQIAIDGVPVGNASYGGSRPDVCLAVGNDPGCPNVGFNFGYDTTLQPDGVHTVAITAVTVNGQSFTTTSSFTIAN